MRVRVRKGGKTNIWFTIFVKPSPAQTQTIYLNIVQRALANKMYVNVMYMA